ncbi:hypothetical protein DB31_2476 [Hyalangium minutum]|uniref:Uncharacterized protein n=1 Tax=Hyalangium minutum TaxID=394096 RepID=A0A085W8Q0_9BACT|nr:hypothetical protein DB31_2476 [Hyalangium minutum]
MHGIRQRRRLRQAPGPRAIRHHGAHRVAVHDHRHGAVGLGGARVRRCAVGRRPVGRSRHHRCSRRREVHRERVGVARDALKVLRGVDRHGVHRVRSRGQVGGLREAPVARRIGSHAPHLDVVHVDDDLRARRDGQREGARVDRPGVVGAGTVGRSHYHRRGQRRVAVGQHGEGTGRTRGRTVGQPKAREAPSASVDGGVVQHAIAAVAGLEEDPATTTTTTRPRVGRRRAPALAAPGVNARGVAVRRPREAHVDVAARAATARSISRGDVLGEEAVRQNGTRAGEPVRADENDASALPSCCGRGPLDVARSAATARDQARERRVDHRRATLAAHGIALLAVAAIAAGARVAAAATTGPRADTAAATVGQAAIPRGPARGVPRVDDALALLRPRVGKLIQARAGRRAGGVLRELPSPEAEARGIDGGVDGHRPRRQEGDDATGLSIPRAGHDDAGPARRDIGVLRHADDLGVVGRVAVEQRLRQVQPVTGDRAHLRQLPTPHDIRGDIGRSRSARDGLRLNPRTLEDHHQIILGDGPGRSGGGGDRGDVDEHGACGHRRPEDGMPVDDDVARAHGERTVRPQADAVDVLARERGQRAQDHREQRGADEVPRRCVLHV